MSINDVNSPQSTLESPSGNLLAKDNDATSKERRSPSPPYSIPMKSNDQNPHTPNDSPRSSDKSESTPVQRRQRISTLLIIGAVAFLTGVDYAIILPTAWGYLKTFTDLHAVGIVMGALLSGFALSGAIAGLVFGHLSDIGFSMKKLVLIGVGFKIIGNVLYFIGISFYLVIIGRVVAGIGLGLVPPILAEISRRSTPETRTQLLAKILACRQIGLFIGPCFTIAFKFMSFDFAGISITVHNAPGLFMAILWIAVWVNAVFFFFDVAKPASEQKTLSDGWNRKALSYAWNTATVTCRKPVVIVLLITCFIAYFNQAALETTITPFSNIQFGWRDLEVSIVFAIAGIEITLVYIALHFITKKINDQTILLFAYTLLSIACLIGVLVLPFAKVGSTKYLPVFLLFVGFDILALPLIAVTSTSLFMQQMSYDQQGVGQGIQRIFVNGAAVIGPLFAGALLRVTWIMISILFILGLLATFLIILIYPSFSPPDDDDESSALLPTENKK
ncbi:unnamed protein product [Rotaria socialis]|uniref:Major facilitator superfamily (MFS) profile domain-containing protein n=1 Tax=Rotaria socialis TaxID=392032 RepID=A0A817SUJ6_9BILA|nr:unnamed protein product [Rotaria socialis]CAF3337327.1 unnamed protein product [Rotaria socialis]CAF3366535.1 unnamed protein product [Rotaria socialis]CAF3658215.1 unnamed protein product [Rotaria socialis]CAF4456610.1 unnamed protein product [Rotaria socialis]